MIVLATVRHLHHCSRCTPTLSVSHEGSMRGVCCCPIYEGHDDPKRRSNIYSSNDWTAQISNGERVFMQVCSPQIVDGPQVLLPSEEPPDRSLGRAFIGPTVGRDTVCSLFSSKPLRRLVVLTTSLCLQARLITNPSASMIPVQVSSPVSTFLR